MPSPIIQNDLLKNLIDAYRIFSQEMALIKMEKFNLIKQIISRLDVEDAKEARKKIQP